MPVARSFRLLAPALWVVLILVWILDVNLTEVPLWLCRSLTVLAVLSTVGWGVARVRFSSPALRARVPGFLLVLLIATLFGFAGLGHEVGKGYYTDEGHYLHHAREVNAGKPFTRSFVYPHLSYYLDAFALWLADHSKAPVAALSRAVYGVDDAQAVPWLVLRLVTASLGVLTVVPVLLLARRIAGAPAAVLASGLVIFSVHYQEGFQVNISDVPSAFFATLTMMFVGRLLEEERLRDYVLAGTASGLAAAAKYPAGVVAVAILGIWVAHRIRRRRWGWGLLWAGLASLGTFLLVNPSFFVFPDAAFHGPRGIFFGLRQYGSGGWVGVMPESNAVYYARQLLTDFRWPAVLLAAAGAFGLGRTARRRLLLLAPFPVAYLVLVGSMNMAVLRNLFPVIPTLAVFLGVAVSGLGSFAAGWTPRRRLAAAAVALTALAWPAAAAVRQTVTLVRPSTRDLMSAWVREHVPVGAGLLKESYTPDFKASEYRTVERRFAYRIPEERFDDPRFDLVLLAGSAYWRWFRPENEGKPWGAWYRRLFETHELVHQEDPGPWRRGPELRLYRIARGPDDGVRRDVFLPEDAFLTHPSMRGDDEIRFTERGRTAVFSAAFEPGRYRFELAGRLRGPGLLRARDLEGRPLVEAALGGDAFEAELADPGKVFLAISLARGSRVRTVKAARHDSEGTKR